MNDKENVRALFAGILILVLFLSACGTLEIDTEPAASDVEVAGTAAELSQETSVLVAEETVVATDVIPVPEETSAAMVGVEEGTAGLSQGVPVQDLSAYTNDEFGFALNYPAGWTPTEVNGEAYVGPGSRSVQFSQGTARLIIGYRRSGESMPISGSGVPAGEFEVRDRLQVVGQDVDRHVIVYEGKDKVVIYGEPGSSPLSAGGLEFNVRLDDFNPDYDNVELSQSIQDEADMILSSLAILEVEAATDYVAADHDKSSWQTYTNEQVGYSLMIPVDAEIMSLDPSERVAFVGPEVDGKPQYQIMVVHYVPNLPESTDYRQDLVEGHLAFLDSLGVDPEGMVEEMSLAGKPAIRIRYPGTGETDPPRDDFIFMHGDTMFQISISHFEGVADQSLNDQFFKSITFGEN